MLQAIAIFTTTFLIIVNLAGDKAKKEKHVTDWLIFGRLCFFVLLTVSIIKLILTFPHEFWIGLGVILYLILVYAFMETNFRLKRETFGNPNRSYMVIFALVIALIAVTLWF
ncbi:MAG TPA: hypothetical protein H9720_03135 [Candidatus Limosilactobacillus intestinigallinarum]|nr:hypothetical protein [Candidatus Limosilactobacillus intestinigallinarum]